ncbi:MAG: Gfo/Idh/MocA family oxidoreductase [Candidatus Hydrogenedentes bacterium]|nr:Gfo/Idh/MocA family oxidoreductase [Candidatus Hydrogenedentota bacterium]
MFDKHDISRRGFIKTGALAAGASVWSAKSNAQVSGANGRLNIGIIGCGNMGTTHLNTLLALRNKENVSIHAVCDVYEKRVRSFADKIADAGGDATPFGDYRELLAMNDIDYVVIATPEHSHHRIALNALNAGKHVYCEKPLCYDIKESKEIVETVRRRGLKLQVGVQGMADDSYSSAYEAIRAGKIGPVVEAQIDYVRNHARDRGPWRKRTDPKMKKPRRLDWKEWVEPREKRKWNPNHYFEWRCYQDYSGGIATDLFVHRITRIVKACGLTYPTRAVGMGGIYMWDDGRDVPDNMEILLEYPAVDGVTSGMTVHFLGTLANKNGIRHCIRGFEATLVFNSRGWEIIDEPGGKKVIETHKKTGGENVSLHHKNLQAAIRNNEPLYCPAELGLQAVVAARMANLSFYERKMVEWDAERQHVIAT